MQKIIAYSFNALFFIVPLILWPYTSEVFEFNKIVVVYILTTLITGTWLLRCINEEKFIFRRTLLDIPILVFLFTQLISTIISIDISTSIFGYYSRFNGGLLSIISYALLYWAYVSNMTVSDTRYSIHFVFFSAILVSIYGVLEHFGIDKHIWVQDVQSRVFSTLGQPNWLAAYIVALIPLIFRFKFKNLNYLISVLLFVTLLFTKSRSGLLGFIIANLTYWILNFIKNRKYFWKPFFTFNSLFIFLALVIGTQFTPSISHLINKPTSQPATQAAGPALETGGTESGDIRKIVWKGALNVFGNYPVFGTGLETFAFSYGLHRPVEHNMVSEWDFVYNKAHNEFLNILANSGIFGLSTYLILITASIIQIAKSKRYDFLSGLIGLHITNFFGFSVVPTQLQLFLFPAMAIFLKDE